jgi:DNA-binding transcriptional LysR family regulator
MDFSHLRLLGVFATVIEVGSFAGAARRLGSSRSRISEQVSQLEAQLGVRLIQRSTRQLNITEEGKRVYDQARRLPDILQEVEAMTTASVPSGRVAMTLNHDIAHKYLLPVLEEFQNTYPEIQLDLVLSDDKLDYIHDQIDLGIRIGIPKDDSLIARVLHEEPLHIYAGAEYLAKHGTPTTLNQLNEHKWIGLSQLQGDGLHFLKQKGQTVQVTPKHLYQSNSPMMLQEMVKAGLGLGVMLPTTVRSEINSGQLVKVMPSLSTEQVVFALVYPSRRQVPVRTRVLIDYLLAANIFA